MSTSMMKICIGLVLKKGAAGEAVSSENCYSGIEGTSLEIAPSAPSESLEKHSRAIL